MTKISLAYRRRRLPFAALTMAAGLTHAVALTIAPALTLPGQATAADSTFDPLPIDEPAGWLGHRPFAQAPQGAAEEMQSFAAHEMEGERLVKGAPYCADAVHETVQMLPDARGAASNRIVRRQTTRLCRDGEGRTRQELEQGGTRRVYPRDPVARQNWVLEPSARTARRLGSPLTMAMQLTLPPGLHDGQAWREHADQLREWARGLGPHRPHRRPW